jgi:hypothetical protein
MPYDTEDHRLKVLRAEEARALAMPQPPAFDYDDPDRHMRPRKRWSAYDKLAMRLNTHEGEKIGGIEHLNIFEGPNYVFVFIVHGEKAIILEDDVALFPSDGLIGRFRLATQS